MPIRKPAQQPAPPPVERRHVRDLDGLRRALEDPDAVTRRWAARDLATHVEAAADLVARVTREAEPAVREAILVSLTQIGDAVAVQGLVAFLRSEDAALRNHAIEAMKQIPAAVAAIMTPLLQDPEPDVRIFAVNVLESLRHPDVEKWLLRVICEDPHINVCATAVDLLGEVGTASAIAPLEALARRFPDEPYIGFAADVALRRLREG